MAVTIGIACLAVYSSSFNGAFVFDDEGAIVSAENIRHLSEWRSWPRTDPRPVVTLSLAINYAISGLRPFSYHVVNLTVHILAAWTLFGIVRRTLMRPKAFPTGVAASSHWIAFVIAIMWALHPLQTQAVSYVIQRSEAMMSLFGLLMLFCFIRGLGSPYAVAWYALSVVACLLGMGCKAGIPTMPFVILMYDYLFVTRSPSEILRRRGVVYGGQVAAVFGVLGYTGLLGSLLSTNPGFEVTVGFGLRTHTPLQYLASQPSVLLKYLQLAFWPSRLCIDYEWEVVQQWKGILLPAIPLVAMMGLTLWALARRHWSAILGVWFFGVLAPSSSFVPVKDLAMEHRMYLALAGVIGAAFAAGYALLGRLQRASGANSMRIVFGGALVGFIAATLGTRTYARNKDYESPASLWRATVEARPENARAWTNYGEALGKLNQSQWAADAFRKAIALDANVPDVYYNLGNALQSMKQYAEAEQSYLKAISLAPSYMQAHIMLGNLYENMGRLDKAEDSLRTAIAQQNRSSDRTTLAKAFYNLGNTLAKRGQMQEAMANYRLAVEANPNYDKARFGLGWALERTGNKQEALQEYIRSVELNPANAEARIAMQALAHELGIPLPASVSPIDR